MLISSETRTQYHKRCANEYDGLHGTLIAAISTGSGQDENPSELLVGEMKKGLQSLNDDHNLPHVLYSSFGATKDQLSVTNPRIRAFHCL